MLIETSIIDVSGSLYIRLPATMAEYFKVDKMRAPLKCKIEDLKDNQAKITFPKW